MPNSHNGYNYEIQEDKNWSLNLYQIIWWKNVYFFTVSTDDLINNTNNDSAFTETKKIFEEAFEIKIQEGSVIRYLKIRIYLSPLGVSIYQTYNIMDLVNGWLLYGEFINLDTPYQEDYTYEIKIIDKFNWRELHLIIKKGNIIGNLDKLSEEFTFD